MDAYARYFAKTAYKPQYYLGDRVRGIWRGKPYSGTVAIDSCPHVDGTPGVHIFLDLPLLHDGHVYTIITALHSEVKSM